MRLPHRDAPWHALVPGRDACCRRHGADLDRRDLPGGARVESSQSAYGALGVAATLLFGLYIVSRLIVASAVLNATVWDRTELPRLTGRADRGVV